MPYKTASLTRGVVFFCLKKIMKKIIINGEIGWEVTTQGVRADLDAAAGDDLDIQIASPGGYVSTGLAIFNLFRDYKREHPGAQIVATIKGVAASMATYLAVNPAFDLVVAEDNAVFMIHNAMGGASGDYRDMRKMAEILDGVTQIIGKAYTAKTGTALEEIRDMMDDETWLFGDEIKAAGFVDEIIKSEDDANKESALAQAHIKFDALAAHMAEKRDDIKQIAALITDEIAIAHNPAPNAGKNTMEVQGMNFEQLLAQNPAAKAEYDAIVRNHESEKQAQFDAGKIEGENAVKARIAKAAPYLMADCKYPNQIKDLAVGVIKSEKSIEGLETAVAVYDALAEKANSEAAAAEAASSAVASGQQDDANAPEAKFQSMVEADKKNFGMEVK